MHACMQHGHACLDQALRPPAGKVNVRCVQRLQSSAGRATMHPLRVSWMPAREILQIQERVRSTNFLLASYDVMSPSVIFRAHQRRLLTPFALPFPTFLHACVSNFTLKGRSARG